jgi:hypothetical protein
LNPRAGGRQQKEAPIEKDLDQPSGHVLRTGLRFSLSFFAAYFTDRFSKKANEMVEIHLYGKLRSYAQESGVDHGSVIKIAPEPEETLEQLLTRIGIPLDRIYTIFFNSKLLAARSAMAYWIGYQQVHKNPLQWNLDVPVTHGDRVGLFGKDMAALIV